MHLKFDILNLRDCFRFNCIFVNDKVGMKVLTSAMPMNLSRIFVSFLKTLKPNLSDKANSQLDAIQLGISVLRSLPTVWADRCSHLVENPALIIESLIMAQQTVILKKLLSKIDGLQNDNLFIHYARKAIGLDVDPEALPWFFDPNANSASSQASESSVKTLPSMLSISRVTNNSETHRNVFSFHIYI